MLTKILVVEDDEVQRGLLAQMLSARGHFVETASDGLEAVRKVRIGAFDVVLMDYRMPQIDGLAAARLITHLTDPSCRPRLIGISATPEALPASTDCSPALFDAVMAKPCAAEPLLKAVRGPSSDQPGQVADAPWRDQPAAAAPRHAPPTRRQAAQTLPDPIRVMVVDDDATSRGIASAALEAAGCLVQSCADGFEALQILARCKIDVVVLDLLMPDIDGLATARLAFEFLSRADRPRMIALTSAPDQLAARETGSVSLFDMILSKSSALSAVIDAVRQSAEYHCRCATRPVIGFDELTCLTTLFPPPPMPPPPRPGETHSERLLEDLPPALDAAIFGQVAACLPRPTLAASLRTLLGRAEDLLQVVCDGTLDSPELVHATHALAGSAGLLGFRRLSEACLAYERATLHDPSGAAVALANLPSAIRQSLVELARLSAELGC
jgi:CheY-like chemotaxis protein/HPt (histidine-containing phosphotransfer) domain-containing protein